MFTMQIGGEGLRERVRWSGCGLLAGLVIGMVLGWMFHGIIGTAFKLAVILLFILPFIAAVAFWISNNRGRTGGSSSTIQEASWRDLGGRGRDGT
jgi:hypothetical protein